MVTRGGYARWLRGEVVTRLVQLSEHHLLVIGRLVAVPASPALGGGAEVEPLVKRRCMREDVWQEEIRARVIKGLGFRS